MLRSFEGLMGGLFDKTEERSRSLAARLSSEVGGTLDETDRRLAETEERSRATAADIRMAVETAIQDAASRFEGATDEIRRTAEVIREELSSARAEIRSGVFQLPEETRESTEAMRRAVSDQIRALRDLSEIVQRTGSAIDVAPAPSRTSSAQTASRPAASQPQRPSQPPRREPEPSRAQPRSEPRVEERQTAGPSAASKQEFDEGDFEEQLAASFLTDGNLARDLRGSDTSMSRPQQPAPSREAQRTQPPTADRASAAYGSGVGPSRPVQGPPPAPRSSSAPSTYGSRAPASQPAAPLREPQSAPQRPVMQTAPEETTDRPPEPQGRGWVSDLLRRASQEEEEAARKGAAPAETSAPAPQGQSGSAAREPLGSLSVEMARAVDPATATDLWQRYRRGESNVFTRRLYTLQGQQTFDTVRRRYQRDPEFKSVVDRYVADFESLMAETARRDPNVDLTRNHLLTERGKVYTMLAHASGRLNG